MGLEQFASEEYRQVPNGNSFGPKLELTPASAFYLFGAFTWGAILLVCTTVLYVCRPQKGELDPESSEYESLRKTRPAKGLVLKSRSDSERDVVTSKRQNSTRSSVRSGTSTVPTSDRERK
ncbi:unnamed protein product, partial [Mesorhabditis spiculigera]